MSRNDPWLCWEARSRIISFLQSVLRRRSAAYFFVLQKIAQNQSRSLNIIQSTIGEQPPECAAYGEDALMAFCGPLCIHDNLFGFVPVGAAVYSIISAEAGEDYSIITIFCAVLPDATSS